MEHIRSLQTGIMVEFPVMSTSQGTYMTYGHIRNIYGLELGTADVAYCSNVVSGIMVCERMCIQGAWLWTVIAGRVGHSLSVLSG